MSPYDYYIHNCSDSIRSMSCCLFLYAYYCMPIPPSTCTLCYDHYQYDEDDFNIHRDSIIAYWKYYILYISNMLL